MTTETTTTFGSRPTPSSVAERPLYDPMTGRFNVRRLQQEIFIRGWTTEEFVLEVTCGRSSVFKALRGEPVRNKTGRAIIEGLDRRAPRLRLFG
jgi:hypothetical protein